MALGLGFVHILNYNFTTIQLGIMYSLQFI